MTTIYDRLIRRWGDTMLSNALSVNGTFCDDERAGKSDA